MKLADLKPGDKVRLTFGGGCTPVGAVREVQLDTEKNALWTKCTSGRHYLDGQEDEDGELIGVERA